MSILLINKKINIKLEFQHIHRGDMKNGIPYEGFFQNIRVIEL